MKNLMLLNALESHRTVAVQFRTKAGTVRNMACTRLLEAVPEEQQDGIYTTKLNGPDIVSVYDHLIKEWRAFRWDSVIAFEPVN